MPKDINPDFYDALREHIINEFSRKTLFDSPTMLPGGYTTTDPQPEDNDILADLENTAKLLQAMSLPVARVTIRTSPYVVEVVRRYRPRKVTFWTREYWSPLSVLAYTPVKIVEETKPAMYRMGNEIVCHPAIEQRIRDQVENNA